MILYRKCGHKPPPDLRPDRLHWWDLKHDLSCDGYVPVSGDE